MFFRFLFVLMAAMAAFAQAKLDGIVKDSSGAVIPDATVELGVRQSRTDGEGRFHFEGAPGTYRLRVARDGFTTSVQNIEMSGAKDVEIQLELSPIVESVSTVSRTEESAIRVPFLVTAVQKEELEKSGAATLDDALRSVAGLQHGTQGNVFTRVATRGTRDTADVLVLVDGVPLRQLNGSADLTMLPMQMVQELEFVKGPASSVYGRSAIGGVMQFFTVPDSRTPSGNVGFGAASFGTYEGFGAFTAPWKTGRVAGSAMASTSDGFQRGTDRDTAGVSAIVEQSVGTRTNLKLHYLFSDVFAKRGSIVPLVNGRPYNNITREDNFGIPDARFDANLHSLSPRVDVDLGRGQSLSNVFNFNRYNRFFTGGITILPPPQTATKGYSESDSVQDTVINDLIYQWRGEMGKARSSLAAGFTYEWGQQDATSPTFTGAPTFRGPDYRTPVAGPLAGNDPRGIRGALTTSFFRQNIESLYVQDRLDFGRLGLTGGLRWDRFDQSLRRTDTGAVSASVRSRVSPRVGFDVAAVQTQPLDVILFGNWVEGFRPQFPALSTQNNLVVAQLLRPEVTRSYEGGVRVRASRVSTQATWFDMKKIDGQRSFRSGPEVFTFVNATTRVSGLEWETRARVRQHTMFWNYAFHNARHVEFRPTLTADFSGYRVRMTPRHFTGAGAVLQLGKHVSYSPGINYVGSRPLRDNIVNPMILPSYTTFSSAVTVDVRRFRIIVAGSNLNDAYYIADDFSAQDAGNPGMPRRLSVQLRYRF